jgi:hypothetical protein
MIYVSCNTNTVIKCKVRDGKNIVKKRKNYELSSSENICCCL